MSSSIHESVPASVFFMVQSGIVFWENALVEIAWDAKTLSICGQNLCAIRESGLGLLVAAEASRLWFRLHVCELPVSRAREHQLERVLSADPPGFHGTVLCRGKQKAVVISKLSQPDIVDFDYLTSYRDTMLLGLPEPAESEAICSVAEKFGGFFQPRTVRTLLNELSQAIVCRVLDMETHFVFQMIGNVRELSGPTRHLDSIDALRVVDPADVPALIAAWTIPDPR